MRRFLLLSLMMAFSAFAIGQTRTVTGSVIDDAGQPVPFASITEKGTSRGTSADAGGHFSIQAANGMVLVFSATGYLSQEVVVRTTPITVALTKGEGETIEEVVVTALGISRDKRSLGSAVQSVSAGELVQAASPNVISSLSGKVAGMQVNQAGGQIGASARIVLRGNSSLGDNQPLIVVDGIPVSNSTNRQNSVDYGSGLNDINPQDIESVTVLKGGAAAALYGMRAGHGVILITTKSGAKAKKGIAVEYEGNYNVDQMYGLQKLQNKYGQGNLGDEWNYNKAKKKGYTGSYQEYVLGGYDPGQGFKYVDGLGNGVNDGVDESWGPRLDVGLMIPQYNSPRDATGNLTATPWISHPSNVKDLYQLGMSMSHNISLSANTEKTFTRLALGYRDQKGTLPNTDLKRYNANVNSMMKFNDNLEYDIMLNYARTESKNLPLTDYNASNPMQSLGQWFGRQVDLKDLKAHWRETMKNGYPYNWNSNYHNNPFWSLNKNTNTFTKNRVFGKTSLYYIPTNFLKFEGRLGLDYYDAQSNPIVSYRSNETLQGAGSWNGGWFRLSDDKNTELNADAIAYFNKSFNKLSVNVVAGANYRNLRWSRSVMGANVLTVPDLFTISNASGSPVNLMDHSWVRSNSIYSSLSLGYDNFVFLDGTFRKDWSSTLRTPFSYPSLSLSFLPLDAFGVKSDIVDFLKIRGGWAVVGSATSPYNIDRYFTAETTPIKGVTQYYQARVYPPPALAPEKVETKEVGLEANMFNNRLGLDVAYYNKTTTNQILAVSISKATGYDAMLVNAGNINNKGIELQLKGTPVKTKDFEWNISLNWAKDKSRIIELYTDPNSGEPLQSYNIGSQWSVYVQARPGQPWGDIYGTGMLRRQSDGAIIVNESGIPYTSNNIKLGNVTPDWLGGLRNVFTYKNLSLGFMLDMRKGGDIYSVSTMFGAYSGALEITALDDFRENGVKLGKNFMKDYKFVKVTKLNSSDIQQSEFAENDIAVGAQDFFRSYNVNRELSVYDGSYLKLRETFVSYQLPQSLFKETSLIKGGSIALVGTNMAILWLHKSNLSKLDPENTVSAENEGVGLETTSYPPSRSMGIKLNLRF